MAILAATGNEGIYLCCLSSNYMEHWVIFWTPGIKIVIKTQSWIMCFPVIPYLLTDHI